MILAKHVMINIIKENRQDIEQLLKMSSMILTLKTEERHKFF